MKPEIIERINTMLRNIDQASGEAMDLKDLADDSDNEIEDVVAEALDVAYWRLVEVHGDLSEVLDALEDKS